MGKYKEVQYSVPGFSVRLKKAAQLLLLLLSLVKLLIMIKDHGLNSLSMDFFNNFLS